MLSESKKLALQGFVATVEGKFPVVMYKAGGSRAQEAARLVENGEIVYVGESYGVDYYRCHGHTTSIKGGHCTCADDGATVDGKKFCKHRLAAMFLVKLAGVAENKLVALFQNAPSDEMTLRVYVLHTVDGNKYRMEGHRYGGGSWVRYEHDDCWNFTQKEFDEVAGKAGWAMVQRPVKQPSMYYHYMLVRGEGAYALDSVHAAAHEKHLQERKFTEIRGITEDGNEVFAALPESLQKQIKENMYAH